MKKPNLTFPDKQIIPTKTAVFDDRQHFGAHAPGPWTLTDGELATFENGLIAKVYVPDDFPCLDEDDDDFADIVKQMAANGHLLTAAPDLAAALEPVAREIIQGTPDVFEDNWNPDAHAEHITLTIAECRAILRALQKASGVTK